ncbi:hypothetical protein KAJ61_05140 [Candidatus Parcubacteria bacterium]|nr:hypothetical protein [Candidatus Parcubacteria bacterium]
MSTTTIEIMTNLTIEALPHLLTFLLTLFVSLRLIKWHYKKEKRLFDNLSRPFEIYTISDNIKSMEVEINLIKKNKFFHNCPDKALKDLRNVELSENLSLVILAIDLNTKEEDFNNALNKVSSLKKPLILYTLGDKQIKWLYSNKDIKDYPLHTISNTPLRLVSDIFTILSTYKNDK